MSAAASPPPTPSATPRRSRAGARRASTLDGPVNIHLTGCHHSCAQHYIGDIGLIACKVPVSDEGDTVEGYHILSAAASARDAGARRARSSRREGGGRAARRSSACSRPISRTAPRPTRPSSPSRAATRSRRSRRMCDAEAVRMSADAAARRSSQLIPETAPFTPEQRAWLNGFFAGLVSLDGAGVTRAVAGGGGGADAGARRRGRRRRDDDDAPWHDQTLPMAERMKLAEGTPAAPPHDGGDGAAGLRPVRLQLRGLFRRAVSQEGGAAESLRAGRQGNRPHAQDALRRSSAFAAAATASSAPAADAPAAPATPRRAPGCSRDNPAEATFLVAHAPQQAGLREGDLAHRVRSRRHAASTMRSATPSASSRPTIRRWSTR